MRDDLAELKGTHIVFCNWRDLGHPRAGGAEAYCEAIAARFVEAGATVTLLTARPPGHSATETRNGVSIVRSGGDYGVYVAAALWLLRHRGSYDVVIDFQNGIPFFAPVFAGRKTPVVCVIHHVHQDQFVLYLPRLASLVARFLEGPASRWLYGHRPIAAVSPSTRSDVRRRLALRGPIHVVPNGSDPVAAAMRRRDSAPRIVCVSRLVAHKRLERVVQIAAELRCRWPRLTVDIAGDGPEREALEALAEVHGVSDVIRFHGFVSERDRAELLASAWLTVNPSVAEGWGLTVIEANAAGVPAVALRVPGLADSVLPGVTGWLADADETLAATVSEALTHLSAEDVAEQMSGRCRQWAAQFGWDATARRMAAIVMSELDSQRNAESNGRREPSDLAVVAEFDDASKEIVDALLALRRTDAVHVRGVHTSVLLTGCDEFEAASVFRRLALPHQPRLRLATAGDLLVPGEALSV